MDPATELLWDPRVDAYRAPAYRYQVVLNSLGESIDDQVTSKDTPLLGKWAPIELRPYQETARDLWGEALGRGIVVLPTGAGKTRLALSIAAHAGGRTLCLVPTRALLGQWRHEVAKLYSGQIGTQGDGIHTVEAFTIATYESAYRRMSELGNLFDLLIIDECHHFGRGARDETLMMSIASRRLGLTATLPSAEDWLNRLNHLIGPPVFELSVGDLAGSYLADFDCYYLHVDLNPAERFQYQLEIASYQKIYAQFRETCPNGSYPDWFRFAGRTEEGRKALQSFQRARKILASASAKLDLLNKLLARHWDKKILIFTADTEVAYRIAREHLVMPVTSEIGRQERERMLLAFRQGRIRALVSCRVLNEGVDVPDAELAIVLGGTQGPREHVQRIGRVLRPSPGKRASIYELVCRATIEVRQSIRRSHPVASPVARAV